MKLVRDKIPEIIKRSGANPEFHIADAQEYRQRLRYKLQEEVSEFLKEPNAEELADILEVIRALSHELGVTYDDVEDLRKKKAAERGGFSKRIILE